MMATPAADRLPGVWSLRSLRRFRNGVFYRYPMGEGATGRIIYSSDGYMCAFLMSPQWLQGAGKSTGSSVDFLSHSGRWRFSNPATVVHEVDAASVFEFIGRPLIRYVSFTEAEDLLLRTEPHTTSSGQKSHDELVWARVT
jgi:hypothetical protein